jgi:aryl-alcohol dehydrogenase-like predicted oxidoreductase
MGQPQGATAQGTAVYRDRFRGQVAEGHFRQSQELWMSSIGLGTYLGHHDERTDAAYRAAVQRAAELGCNVFDTAANYRFQRSERNIGDALAEMIAAGKLARHEVIVTTKGGYIPFENEPPQSRDDFFSYLEETFIKPGVCRWEDFVQGSHCMTPGYLAHQLDQSRRNLKLETIDVYYLHNPESQFAEVAREEFYARLRAAFEFLESAVAAGKILMYGTATWDGYRVGADSPEFLELERVVQTAREVAGEDHHFKVVQLPLNVMMLEALAVKNQPLNGNLKTFLEAAAEIGITVMSSASMLQARLATHLPSVIGEHLTGLTTDAQRAIQFTRSTPGLTTALVGMSRAGHVEENLAVARVPPAPREDYLKLFRQS